jgi:hypothetical protein
METTDKDFIRDARDIVARAREIGQFRERSREPGEP